ncbi:YchJ family metal-binding protein [Burkholderia sp. Ac-20392]|uniref:YchJ family metal-binding protein n=1 Tax=Burkholderia sp. Ac-20392 TaxID=2703905 RepID=UPI003217B393
MLVHGVQGGSILAGVARHHQVARTCPPDLDTDPEAPDAPRWLGLAVKRHAPLDERHAEVEFVARYKVGGRAYRLHETSRFERDEHGFWRYVDGEVSER